MTAYRYRTSSSDQWTTPRPYTDASLRRKHYGSVHPMPAEKAGLSDWALRAWMVLITLGTIFYIYHGA